MISPDVRRGMARRVRWGLVDQAVSSLTNFAIVLIVARVADRQAFGTFAVAYVVYLLLLWGSRSLVTEPLVIRFSARARPEQHEASRHAASATMAAGMASAFVLLVIGAIVGGVEGAVVAAFAVSLPGLFLQDTYRYALFAQGRPRSAAVNDALWFGIQLALVGLLVLVGRATPVTVTLAFGAGAWVSAGLGVHQTRVWPSRRGASWVVNHRDLGGPLFLELLAVSGAAPIALLAIALIDDATLVGGIRAATLLFGPLTMLFMGLFIAGVPEGVRMSEHSVARLSRVVTTLGMLMPLTTLCWMLGLVLVPDQWGTELLKSNWAEGRALIVPVGAQIAGNACAFAALIGLRSLGAVKRSLRARIWSVPVTLAGGVFGAALAGGRGAATGLALGCWVDAGLAWVSFRRASNEGMAREPLVDEDDASSPPFEPGDIDLPVADGALNPP